MRLGTRRIYLALSLTLALLGCDTHKQQAIDNARSHVEYELKAQARQRSGDANTPYLVSRYEKARAFLAEGPSLEAPYMVWADLWISPTDPSTSGMGLQWMEYSSHAVGIVLVETSQQGRRQWQLPVLEWEKDLWAKTEGTAWRETVLRSRRLWLMPTEDAEPLVRMVVRGDGRPPVELAFPRSMSKSDLAVGVYDDKGDVSNLVPPFIWPREPDVTE